MPKVFERPKEEEPAEDKSGFVRNWRTEVTDAPDFVEAPPRKPSKKTLIEQAAGRKALQPYEDEDEPEAKG